MNEPIQIKVVLPDIDLEKVHDEQYVSDIFVEKLREFDLFPTDNYVSLRHKKMSNIRGKRLSTQEDVEMYALSQTLRENGTVFTVVLIKVV